MRAAFIRATGPAENIVVGEIPTPEPRASEVLVKVNVAALNPIDTYIRSGRVAMPLSFPFVLGRDLAGTVERVGSAVQKFKPGDRVWGSNQGVLGRQGTFAQYAVVDQCWLYPTPASVSDEQAAAVALVGMTAGVGLLHLVRLQAGETLFVNGGAGGIGSCVVQMAKALGARAIATAGSDEKVQACRELGADLAINYQTQDVAAEVKQFAPNGLEVYWETVQEPDFDRIVSMLATRGRIVLMAGRAARPQFPVGAFYIKGCTLFGLTTFLATADEQRDVAERMNDWLAAGKLRVLIGRSFPLSEAASAHRLQEDNTLRHAGTLVGKIIVKPWE